MSWTTGLFHFISLCMCVDLDIDNRECWECALTRMQELGRSVGVSIDTKLVTTCSECQFM